MFHKLECDIYFEMFKTQSLFSLKSMIFFIKTIRAANYVT